MQSWRYYFYLATYYFRALIPSLYGRRRVSYHLFFFFMMMMNDEALFSFFLSFRRLLLFASFILKWETNQQISTGVLEWYLRETTKLFITILRLSSSSRQPVPAARARNTQRVALSSGLSFELPPALFLFPRSREEKREKIKEERKEKEK